MSAIIDTLAISKRYEAAGFSSQQAEVLAEEQIRLIEEHIATKRDLKDLEQSIILKVGAMIVALGTFMAAIKFLQG